MTTQSTHPIELKDSTTLISAQSGTGYEIPVYDDCWGTLWICGHEFGPNFIIRAHSFDTAYEIWLDETPTIDESELWEAHGFDSVEEFKLAVAASDFDWDRWNYGGLAEGYQYQSNFTGTGIVNEGFYAWLQELTPAYMLETGIRISIASD